jgi:hypothetical protein
MVKSMGRSSFLFQEKSLAALSPRQHATARYLSRWSAQRWRQAGVAGMRKLPRIDIPAFKP